MPAKISKASSDLVKGYTKLLYRRTNLRGIVRADFLLSGGEVYFNEMNTVPGSMALVPVLRPPFRFFGNSGGARGAGHLRLQGARGQEAAFRLRSFKGVPPGGKKGRKVSGSVAAKNKKLKLKPHKEFSTEGSNFLPPGQICRGGGKRLNFARGFVTIKDERKTY